MATVQSDVFLRKDDEYNIEDGKVVDGSTVITLGESTGRLTIFCMDRESYAKLYAALDRYIGDDFSTWQPYLKSAAETAVTE